MSFPRNLAALLVIAALPLAAAACDTAADDEDIPATDEMTMPEATEPEMAQPMDQTATLEPLNESGISGQVVASAEGAQTRVQVLIAGAPPDATLQGHIHTGTCAAPGPVVVPLEPLNTNGEGGGEAVSTVAVDPATAFNGQHIVVYHEAGGSPGAPVTCAALPMANQM